MNILDEATVNYDILAERLSILLNRLFNTEYLLYTLAVRAKASGFDGFEKYFVFESKCIEFEASVMIDRIIDNDHGINFMQIDAIPTKGNKVYDLLVLFEDCLKKNISVAQEVREFCNSHPEYRICAGNMVNEYEILNNEKLNRANKIRKKLSNVLNDYGALLLIDKQVGDKYHD